MEIIDVINAREFNEDKANGCICRCSKASSNWSSGRGFSVVPFVPSVAHAAMQKETINIIKIQLISKYNKN